eukprot:1545924-Pyramimonas_sp.AAC.1
MIWVVRQAGFALAPSPGCPRLPDWACQIGARLASTTQCDLLEFRSLANGAPLRPCGAAGVPMGAGADAPGAVGPSTRAPFRQVQSAD